MLPRPLPASATFYRRSIIFILVVMVCSAPILADQPKPIELPETISFDAHIRPIMSNTCFTCHGPDEDDNPSGLRLDSFEMATEAAIVPGKAKSSAVFQRITDDADPMTLKKTSPSRQAYATAPARPSLKTSNNADC